MSRWLRVAKKEWLFVENSVRYAEGEFDNFVSNPDPDANIPCTFYFEDLKQNGIDVITEENSFDVDEDNWRYNTDKPADHYIDPGNDTGSIGIQTVTEFGYKIGAPININVFSLEPIDYVSFNLSYKIVEQLLKDYPNLKFVYDNAQYYKAKESENTVNKSLEPEW